VWSSLRRACTDYPRKLDFSAKQTRGIGRWGEFPSLTTVVIIADFHLSFAPLHLAMLNAHAVSGKLSFLSYLSVVRLMLWICSV